MAAGRLYGFLSVTWADKDHGAPWSVFKWNSDADNSDLVTWAEVLYPGKIDCSVDDSGSPSLFLWEQTSDGSASGQVELVTGRYIQLFRFTNVLGTPVNVDSFDAVPDGMWESDEFGRPLDAGDLQAP